MLARLYDADRHRYSVLQDGSVPDGTREAFRGNRADRRGALQLWMRFAGAEQFAPFEARGGRFELDGQQVVTPGAQFGGVRVTRKQYVPRDGYFIRSLEIIENTTAEPLELDVRLQSHYRTTTPFRDGFLRVEPYRVVASADGDLFYSPGADPWVILDDEDDADPFRTSSPPAVGHLVESGDDVTGPDGGGVFVDDESIAQVRTEWSALIIPSGESVALLHFSAQRSSRAGARAALDRLGQAPEEALVGLTDGERAAVANFDLDVAPPAPLPALTGVVQGRVLEGDDTPLPRSQVFFKSAHPIFDRMWWGFSDNAGGFAFAGALAVPAQTIPVPEAGFEVWAIHPHGGVESPRAEGGFPAPGEPTTEDVVFDTTGRFFGVVRRALENGEPGNVVSNGHVEITGEPIGGRRLLAGIAIDGRFSIGGLPPGDYTLTAVVPVPGASPLSGAAQGRIFAAEATESNLTLIPTGGLTGLMLDGGGNPAIDVQVDIAIVAFETLAQDIELRALANDDRAVARVELLANGAVVGTALRAPYAVSWQLPVGEPLELTLTARAVDSGGNETFSEPVIISRLDDDTPPVVAITAPFAGAQLTAGAPFIYSATAADNVAVEQVEFFIGDASLGVDEVLPYRVDAAVPAEALGDLTLRVVATDRAGNTTEASQVVQILPDEPPSIALVSGPAPDSNVVEGTALPMEVAAQDDVGVTVDVLFGDDVVATRAQAPFIFTPTLPPLGPGARSDAHHAAGHRHLGADRGAHDPGPRHPRSPAGGLHHRPRGRRGLHRGAGDRRHRRCGGRSRRGLGEPAPR